MNSTDTKKRLQADIPEAVWHHLERYTRRTNCTVDEVVTLALQNYLRNENVRGSSAHTIYQASTTTALVEGVYRGAVSVGTLRAHGDLGLGTFEDLDGEMIIVDGNCYQALADGKVRAVGDEVLAPYAVVTKFRPVRTEMVSCLSLEDLKQKCDVLRHTDNIFFSIRVTGRFESIDVRVVCKTPEGTPLVEAAAAQAEFHYENISGTLVGFWSPDYAKTLDVPGYHLHFLSEDRLRGGHLLNCRGSELKLELERDSNLSIILPTNEAFLSADLSRDPSAALHEAESQSKEK